MNSPYLHSGIRFRTLTICPIDFMAEASVVEQAIGHEVNPATLPVGENVSMAGLPEELVDGTQVNFYDFAPDLASSANAS